MDHSYMRFVSLSGQSILIICTYITIHATNTSPKRKQILILQATTDSLLDNYKHLCLNWDLNPLSWNCSAKKRVTNYYHQDGAGIIYGQHNDAKLYRLNIQCIILFISRNTPQDIKILYKMTRKTQIIFSYLKTSPANDKLTLTNSFDLTFRG